MRTKENISFSMRLLAVTLAFFLCGCAPSVIKQACFTDTCVDVAVADNDITRAKGLMFTTAMPASQGMLFVFGQDRAYSFWMKNMRIPLDILWINRFRRVIDIHATVPPCAKEPCETYRPAANVRYVLEVNAGFANAHRIKKGDHVEFK